MTEFRSGPVAKGGGWGVCQRCGFQYDLNDLVKEWTGLRVCRKCKDPRPAQLTTPKIGPEGLASPNASPQPSFTEAASVTYDWPSIAAGSSATTAVTVAGASVGDGKAYTPYMANGWGGLIAYAAPTSPNTVTVTARNPTGQTIDLASDTLTITAV